jgi:DNA-binding PadR family transcriptional regulator
MNVARALAVFLTQPDSEWYGFEIMQETGMPSGLVYPILVRLVQAGWLVRNREGVDAAKAGRPERWYYRLTDLGKQEATTAIDRIAASIGR